MKNIAAFLQILGALLLPFLLIAGLVLVTYGATEHRDSLAIAGAIMLGSLAIAGQMRPSN